MKVIVVAAARPNFMKVAPILAALEAAEIPTTLVHTGQHYDEAMSDAFFADLSMRAPDIHLGCAGGSHAATTANVMLAFDEVLAEVEPTCVVVVGDVDSTLACALAAAKRSIPVAHVEAGLRSRDRGMPEEVNRIVVDAISDWLFTPSPDATANLVAEGVAPERVHWVGNVMVDSLLRTISRVDLDETLERFQVAHGRYALLTLHRPSNVDDEHVLEQLLQTVAQLSDDLPILFPVHPRTAARMSGPWTTRLLTAHPGLRLVPPIGYRDCVALQAGAAVVLTDSGGIQEETTVLGVPCLTLRESTERPVTVTHGTNTVVGTDPLRIRAAFDAALIEAPLVPRCPDGWDGKAAERIVNVLMQVPPPLDVERPVTRRTSLARAIVAQRELESA
jgi:UDP-N-acetylglucosamine 2-epimerase (non-hydrolysing)